MTRIIEFLYLGSVTFSSLEELNGFLAAARRLGVPGVEKPVPELVQIDPQFVQSQGAQAHALGATGNIYFTFNNNYWPGYYTEGVHKTALIFIYMSDLLPERALNVLVMKEKNYWKLNLFLLY